MKRRLVLIGSAAMMLALVALVAAPKVVAVADPPPYTLVTSFAPSTNTTAGVWFEADVRPGGTASVADLTGLGGNLQADQPIPVGAAKLTTDNTNEAKAEVSVGSNYGVLNDIVSTLAVGYSWHKAANAGQNQNAAPSIKLTFFNSVCNDTPGGDCFATLVYEPYMNGFGNFPAQDVWHQSDLTATSGRWWTTGGFGQLSGGGGCGAQPCPTLAQWLAASSPDFGQATLVGVSVGVGSVNPGQIGFFDDVTIGGTLADARYDFDPAPRFQTVGECVSTLVADHCARLTGKARATCNHEQQMTCFDLFGIP